MIKKYYKKFLKFWLEPPDHALNQERNLKSALASDWREIIYIDVIIWMFLLASIHQVAFIFGRGNPEFFHYAKSGGLDAAIWILSRSIAKSSLLSDRLAKILEPYQRRLNISTGFNWSKYITLAVLWLGLIFFLSYTTTVNTMFELWDYRAPAGAIRYVTVTNKMELLTRLISSSPLAFIILFLTFVRMLSQKNMADTYTRITRTVERVTSGEDEREKARIRAKEWRERQKKLKPRKKK